MTGISVDTRQLVTLEHDLGSVAARIVPAMVKVVGDNAERLRDQYREDAANSGHFPFFADSITAERNALHLTAVEYEVGPDKDRKQGALGNILYFGTSKNAPVLDLEGPAHAAEPRFLAELTAVAAESLR